MEQSLVQAGRIAQQYPSELPPETLANISDKLVSYYTSNEKMVEAEEWALLSVKLRKEEMMEEPGVLLLAERYAAACASAGIVQSRLGKFASSERYYREGLKLFYEQLPLSLNAYRTLEYFTSSLHQQGRTDEAIQELHRYEQIIANMENSASALCKTWRRAATLHFTQCEWTMAEALLMKAEELERKEGLPLDLQGLCDFANVYWEMGDEAKARAKEDELRKQQLTLANAHAYPTSRSDLLSTLECSLSGGVYKLELRVNRTKPQRKEGQGMEDPETIPRKLTSCFLEITFENTDPNEPPVTITKDVSSYSILIESPKMKEAEPGRWYTVEVLIYSDSNKTKKLGQHRQLIYAMRTPF